MEYTEADERRYWALVERRGENECWPWKAARSPLGYGTWEFKKGIRAQAHRWTFFFLQGIFRPKQYVLHSCDNPPCCNPAHLSLGSQADNAKDMMAKGRGKEQFVAGSKHKMAKLTEAQVLAIRADPRYQRIIATEYGIAQQHVSRIKRRVDWGHL